MVAALASRYGRQPYLRISRAPSGTADLKSRVISAMGASALEKIAFHAGITGTAGLLGIYDFTGSASRYARLIDGWLNAAPAGSIIMCHPALSPEPGEAIGPARAQEFAYLSSDDFPAALERAGVQLVRGDTWY